jgi:hypothetical protein
MADKTSVMRQNSLIADPIRAAYRRALDPAPQFSLLANGSLASPLGESSNSSRRDAECIENFRRNRSGNVELEVCLQTSNRFF